MYNTEHLPKEKDVLTEPTQWTTFFNYYSQLNEDGTQETWTDACTRAVDNLRYLSKDQLTDNEYQEIFDAIYLQNVLPSMRLFSMPTAAIQRCNTTIYNCSFTTIDTFDSISEMLYLTMSGVGIGYSLESHVISRLPKIPEFENTSLLHEDFIIPDTQNGWADSVQHLFNSVLAGELPTFDYSLIRAAGTPLKTKGGVASGPEPLKIYHDHTLNILRKAQGRQLTSLELHDIVNMISECAVSNGSRSGALICLFSDTDTDMFNAKSDPEWYIKTPWRAYSNNSVVTNGNTNNIVETVIQKLIYDKTGEPGIFNHDKFYAEGRTIHGKGTVGVNPCGEILLPATFQDDVNEGGGSFCNLSTLVLKNANMTSVYEQIRIATLIGTIQAMADDFRYLRSGWKINQNRERLLGVCVTGIYDYKDSFNAELLQSMRREVERNNKVYAKRLGIDESTCSTSVKPSGNSSMLTNTSPGVNPDFGEYQVRNIRVGRHSKMAAFLIDQGVPHVDDPFEQTKSKYVFSFPKRSKSSNTLEVTTAQEQIDNYLLWSKNYTSHNVSVTVTYKDNEDDIVAEWIRNNYKYVTGMAFYPTMANQPYLPVEVIGEEEYNKLMKTQPVIDWRKYYDYNVGDIVQETIAECSGERCDIVWG
jgi:ribonucleoside-triphosphate reductase